MQLPGTHYYLRAMSIDLFECLKKGIITKDEAELEDVAIALARHLPSAVTLALYGDLGAGKTIFVKGLAKAWGIQTVVTSPTFSLFNLYQGDRCLIHMDAYRLNTPESVLNLGLESFLIEPYCFAIEWPEKLGAYLPDKVLNLLFTIESEGHKLQLK